MILKCKCKHPYQDKKHGKGNRVHNQMRTQQDRPDVYACTVCGDQKTIAKNKGK